MSCQNIFWKLVSTQYMASGQESAVSMELGTQLVLLFLAGAAALGVVLGFLIRFRNRRELIIVLGASSPQPTRKQKVETLAA